MANQVKLTFAGDPKPLTDAFDKAGTAAKRMGDDVGQASKRVGESSGEAANGFEKVGGSADNAERNIIGVHDVIDGTATIMKGPGKQGIVAYLQGWADLAGGIAPMAEYLAKTKVATVAQAAAQKAAAAGAKVWAAAQWLMNSALLASPITWIVVGIAAVVAAIVLIAAKTDWFQKAWKVAWSAIKTAASATWSFLQRIPGWIGSAFATIGNAVFAPFRWAFNKVADAWNNTIGQLRWSVPGWVPFIGGNTISVPQLPHFHAGGVVPGPVGAPRLAVLQGGEQVSSRASAAGDGDLVHVTVQVDSGVLLETTARAVRRRSGDPAALGLKIRTA